MAGGVRIPRTRGAFSGLALILLGAWGGLAPFAGPSFGFGFTPDHAWQYTPGRLYLSALPGAVAVLAGIVVLATRSRWFGGLCALLAALAGAWFVAGAALIKLFPSSLGVASVGTGTPISATASGAILTGVGCYTGVGAAIVFFGALAFGRFTIVAYRDVLRAEQEAGADEAFETDAEQGVIGAGSYPAGGYLPGQSPFPPQYPPADPHPSPGHYPDEQTMTETFGGG